MFCETGSGWESKKIINHCKTGLGRRATRFFKHRTAGTGRRDQNLLSIAKLVQAYKVCFVKLGQAGRAKKLSTHRKARTGRLCNVSCTTGSGWDSISCGTGSGRGATKFVKHRIAATGRRDKVYET